MTNIKIRYFIFYAGYAMFCFALILLQSTGLATLQIGTASAVLMLPASVLAGYYFKEFVGVLFGCVFGALLDVYSSAVFFNTAALAVCGFVCGLIMSRFFNSNFQAVCVLDVGASLLYFFTKWIVVYAFTDPAPMFILVHYSIPSAVYTAACGIIMYIILNPLFKKMPVKRRH